MNFALFVILLFCLDARAWSDSKVRTYVIKVQEERESTKWTLTEWLRIKERMKMMDLWMAMFSEPAKDKFRPELHIAGLTGVGSYTKGPSDAPADRWTEARGQLWLTNLFSGVLGVRLLNIDLGVEGMARQMESSDATLTQAISSSESDLSHYGIALRIFGKHVQDTSIVLKYGAYDLQAALPASFPLADLHKQRGRFLAAELQIYLLKQIGLLGHYHSYEASNKAKGADFLTGELSQYGAFIDVSILRLSLGQYQHSWNFETSGSKSLNQTVGNWLGLGLQL